MASIRTVAALILAFLATPVVRFAAQVPRLPEPGERVRLHFVFATGFAQPPGRDIPGFRAGGVLQGTFVSSAVDTVRIQTTNGTGTVAVPLYLVHRVDVQRGRKSAARSGATIGGVLGLIAGGIIGGSNYHESPNPMFDFGSEMSVLGGALVGMVAGATAGGLVGLTIHTDRWVQVPAASLRVVPVSLNRVGVSLAFAY